jgi:hypothetical protein
MDKGCEQNAVDGPIEMAGDNSFEKELPKLARSSQEHERKQARLIQECHAIAYEDALREGASFFGIHALK